MRVGVENRGDGLKDRAGIDDLLLDVEGFRGFLNADVILQQVVEDVGALFVGEAIFLHIGNFGEFFRFNRELLDGDAFLIEVAIDLNDNKVSKTFRVLCFAHAFFEISGHAFVGKDDVGIGGG